MKASVLCFLPMALALVSASASFTDKNSCNRSCGDMSVPFPFGLDESCAWNSNLVLDCNHTSGALFIGSNIPVSDISLENGTVTIRQYRAFGCYDQNGHPLDGAVPQTWINLGKDGHYTFSDTQNKLTVFGCDTSAVISHAAGTSGNGCISYCLENINFTDASGCSGSGCCQTTIPQGLRSLGISVDSTTNYTSVRSFSTCGSAFLVDRVSFNVSDYKLPVPEDMRVKKYSNVVVDWVVERDLTCEEAKFNRSSYACGANSICSDFEDGKGYRCFCEAGYTGNPYNYTLSQGCQDINECEDPQRYPCHGNCKNNPGNYTCNCPFGKTGDGKIGCQISRVVIIIAAVAATILCCIMLSGLVLFISKRIAKERNFRQNGGQILKHQRVKIFTEAQLARATDNYDAGNKLGEGGFASVYKGRIDGNELIAVKRPRDVPAEKPKDRNSNLALSGNNEFRHEISIISQVNHKNLVKLLGICLETKVPLLVYEFIPNGTLYHHIHNKRSTVLQSWKNRLRIASEAALALEYLHSLADPPIIHGDIKTLNILLDENYSAKVADFGASILMSPGQIHIAERVQGTIGYIDPEYLSTGELTMKSDVYSFGVVLMELLTGETPVQRAKHGESINMIQSFISAVENRTLVRIINIEAFSEDEMQEIQAVGSLARRCLNYNGVNRPMMREVAQQLDSINKNSWADRVNAEETQTLLDQTGSDSFLTSTREKNKVDSIYHSAIDTAATITSSNI